MGLIQMAILAALLCAAAFAGGFYKGDEHGKAAVQAEWNEERLRLAALVDEANQRANRSAFQFEEWKSRQETKTVYVTRRIKDANAAAPLWSGAVLPASVRDAVAAAASAVDTGQPDRPLPAASAARPADERRAPGSLRLGPGFLGRVFGSASSPR